MKNKKLGKIIISILVIISLLALSCVGALAATRNSKNTVIIGYFYEPGMNNVREYDEVKSGYAYEYMEEIAIHAGWTYEYVYGSFADLLQKLKDGEIDAMPYVSKTDERKESINFPDMGMIDETFYLSSLKDFVSSDNFKELNGKRIGSNAGYFQNQILDEFINKYSLDCEIVYYESSKKKWDAIQRGDVDITVESSLVLQDVELHPICQIGETYPVYTAFSMSRPDLIDQYNNAQQEIDHETPSLTSSLRVKYFKNIPLFKELSARNKKWLNDHKNTLKIGVFTNDSPLVTKKDDKSAVGIMPDYVKRMFDNYGINLTYEWSFFDTTDQALIALEKGDIDVVHPFYYSYNIAENANVIISTPVYQSSMSILYIGKFEEDTMNRIATPITRLGAYYVKDNYMNSKIVPSKNGYDCIDKVLQDKADSVIMNSTALRKISIEYEEDFNIKDLPTHCQCSFAALPENSAIIDIINRAAPFLTTEEINAIEAGYYVEADQGISIRQFFVQHPILLIVITVFLVLVIGTIVVLQVIRLRERNQRIALQEARDVADNANKAKTEFLFSMSHDIRTPMNAIVGFTNLAKKNIDDKEKVADCINKSQEASHLLLSLINSVLDMSRIETGKAIINETPGDIMLSYDNIKSTMLELAKTKNIDLKFEFGEVEDRYIYADVDRCMRIFTNIISNSVKYTKNGGWIKVRCEQIGKPDETHGLYRYTFEDNGIGMSEEFVSHVFEKFAREETSTISGIQGTGLGLAVCKSFVEVMGGTIDCKSIQGVGTTFTIEIPFRLQTEEEITHYYISRTEAQVESDLNKDEHNNHKLSSKRVLLVEDNVLNLEITKEILEERGMIVETAQDGAVCIEMIRTKGPKYYDFILMDIQMPIMNGYEATKAIRTMYPNEMIPIIAVSANAYEEDKEASLKAGMNDHIAKPINVNELFEKLTRYL